MATKSPGTAAIRWVKDHCRIPEGARVGQPLELLPFQQKIVRGIYDSPTRRAIISFGRKNGKTTFCAVLLLLHLCGPFVRRNSQLYSTGLSRDQAALLFSLAAKIVRMSPDLHGVVQIKDSVKQLICPELGTMYRALSAEATTAYGLSPVFAVHDELGQVRGPRSELYEAIETGAGAHDAPLTVIISTQAPNDNDVLSILIDDAKTGSDPEVKLFLYEAPEDVDPFSAESIRLANPAYGEFLNPKEVLKQADEARRMPSRESAFRNLILNQRVDATAPFISRSLWNACGGEIDPFAFQGWVYLGLDLSARNDLTALAMIGKVDGVWHVQMKFWAPETGLKDRALQDRAPYDVWAEQGHLIPTPGASVDYAWVAHQLVEIYDTHQLKVVAFDRWRIDILKSELSKLNVEVPLEPFGQGYKSMAPALDSIESLLLNGKLRHDNNPVLSWCVANAVATRDPAGNRKLNKAKATGRIDGLVALVMAVAMADVRADDVYITDRLVML